MLVISNSGKFSTSLNLESLSSVVNKLKILTNKTARFNKKNIKFLLTNLIETNNSLLKNK